MPDPILPHPILIVGAGPTGLTAALELSRLGIAVRLIDRLPQPPTTSRAVGVQARTLELMAQRGLADEMLQFGNPARGADIYSGGRRLTRIDLGHVDSRHKYILMLSQAHTERILREAVARQGVAIERGVELVGISQDTPSHGAAMMSAVLRHADGTLERASAPWLIAAEGAHSLLRDTLDLRFEGKTRDQDYLVADLRLDGDVPDHDVHLFSSEHGFLGLFPFGGDRFRLIASHPSSKPRPGTEPGLDELRQIYHQRSHVPARLDDLTWSSWFRINSRMVSRLRVGRVLLGGDSAHIHSPAGGQGMNTGIQDMINLCWKLALVVRGRAPDPLLDTYEQDRLPVMRDLLSTTERLTDLIGSESPAVRALLDRLGPWVGGSEFAQRQATARISQIALGYRHGPLSSNHPHGGEMRAGDRVPDLRVRHRVGGGWREGDLQGLLDPTRFALLLSRGDAVGEQDAQPELAAFADLVTPVELTAPGEVSARRAYQAALGRHDAVYLVRPDAYVAVAAGKASAARALATFARRWLLARQTA